MENKYYLHVQRAGERVWEEVDAYLYKNYKFVINDDGTRRYTDNRFSVVDGVVNVSELKALTKNEMSLIARMLGLRVDQTATGYSGKPTGMLIIARGNSKVFYQNGFKYTGRVAA